MIKRIKPDFSPGKATWIDPGFFPEAILEELTLHLKESKLSLDHQRSLIDYACAICMGAFGYGDQSGKRQRNQIESVAANANRLLASLTLLDRPAASALRAHAFFLAYGDSVPVELDPHIKSVMQQLDKNLLSIAWDWTVALEAASTYAAKQYDLDKNSKPTQARARAYVTMLAEHIQKLTGSKPPKNPASWFAGFCECCGHQVGLKIGPRVVKSGIEALP